MKSDLKEELQLSDVVELSEPGKEAFKLGENLKRRRRKKKRELSALHQPDESKVKKELFSAKQRTRQKILENVRLSAEKTLSPPATEDETTTPRPSPHHSISDVIKQRLEAKRKQARDEAYDEGKTSQRKLAGMRGAAMLTRFDETSMLDEETVKFEQLILEKPEPVRLEETMKNEKDYIPTPKEQFDFCMKEWEYEDEDMRRTQAIVDEHQKAIKKKKEKKWEKEMKQPKGKEGKEESGKDEEGEDTEKKNEGKKEDNVTDDGKSEQKKKKKSQDDEAILADKIPLLDEFEMEEEDIWQLVQFQRAEYIPFHEKIEREERIFYFPSMTPDPNLVKENPARNLEDEGIFVGTKPYVSNRNRAKLENRILMDLDTGNFWFGEDGHLFALPSPLKSLSSRPPLIEQLPPALQSSFYGAKLAERVIESPESLGEGTFQLNIDIMSLKFTHHHLFSREHVLAVRLTKLYEQYLHCSQQRVAYYLKERLNALKAACRRVQDDLSATSDNNFVQHSESELHDRLNEYHDDIRDTRQQYHLELQNDQLLLKNLLRVWKKIKILRREQNHNNTTVKLKIHREKTNKRDDLLEREKMLEEGMAEAQEQVEREHAVEKKLYNERMLKYHDKKAELKKAVKRRRKKEKAKLKQRGSQAGEMELDDPADLQLIDEGLPEKPERVMPLAELVASRREEIKEQLNQILREPGEPILIPELTNDLAITENELCTKGEKNRRNDVKKIKISLKVFINHKEVAYVEGRIDEVDFSVEVKKIFPIQIIQWPQQIHIQIMETLGFSSNALSEVFLATPNFNVTSESVCLDWHEFSSPLMMKHSHEGVGSDVNITFGENAEEKMCLNVSGSLLANVAWAVDKFGNLLAPISMQARRSFGLKLQSLDPVADIGATGITDPEKLTKWIKESKLDPNDPNNAELVKMMKPSGPYGLSIPTHFRIEQLQQEFDFVSDQEMDNSRRLRLLQMRNREVPEFKDFTMVPIHEHEVPSDVFNEFDKKKKSDIGHRVHMDELERHRHEKLQYMRDIQERVLLKFHITSHQKVFSDIIDEDLPPKIKMIPTALLKLAEPRRPLRPQRKERKKATAQNIQNVQIIVNVIRAFDIPVRDKLPPSSQDGGPTEEAEPNQPLVRPFVEIMFQRNVEATSVSEGSNPSWNEELKLQFNAPNKDFRPMNLQKINDSIFVNLFDEYIVETKSNSEELSTISQRIEKRWLGNFQIPFSTIYNSGRIDGTFLVQKPPILLGYCNEKKIFGGEIDVGMGHSSDTYLTLFVTMEPALVPVDPAREKFETNESDELMIAAEKWKNDVLDKFPKRNVLYSVIDTNGKSVFLTRYLSPIKSPYQTDSSPTTPSQQDKKVIARYVSMIPFVSDAVSFPGVCDIWYTCDQFLDLRQGDEEEHAVLLANFFLALNMKAWLVLGRAIPEGETAYVLTCEEDAFVLWNANSGRRYRCSDAHCPLMSIGCVVDPTNIWANVQREEQPSRVEFDFGNSKHWKPVFHKAFPRPELSSIQPERLDYSPIANVCPEEEQDKIERYLKEKLMDWRPQQITRWNRYCMQTFRTLLASLEENLGKLPSATHTEQLKDITSSYKLCGFPLNMAHGEMSEFSDAVFATGVHTHEGPGIEFALAVHLTAHPKSIYSIWIYVASLVRRR